MKNGLLSLSLILAFISLTLSESSAQVCTPDPLFTQPGIWPDSVQGINPAFQCVPYAQTLTVVVPIDTFVSGQAVWIDSIVLTGMGGLPAGLTYECDPPGCGFDGGTTGCVLISGTPLQSGSYDIDAYTISYATLKAFALSSSQNDTISYYNLGVSQTLILSASASNASCIGICDGSATVNPSGGGTPYTYIWDDPANQTSQTANNLCAGVYAVTVSGTSGCYSEEIVTITNSSVLTTSMVTTDATCGMPNGSATAITSNGTAPYTYIWSSGDTNNAASGLTGGTYTVNVTDAAGCSDSLSGSVGGVAPILLTYTSTSSTCGNSDGAVLVSVSGGTPPYNGWGGGMTDTTISGLSSGTYTISITDAQGCMDSIITTVNDTGGLVVMQSSIVMASCNGVCDGEATASATGVVGTLTYSWNTAPIQSGAAITGLCAGTYVATVNDSSCTTSLNVTITEPVALTTSVSSTSESETGAADGTATVIANGGTGTLTISWNTTPVQNSTTATDLSGGDYVVTVVDSMGCTISETVTVTVTVGTTFEDISNELSVVLYPNPAENELNIEVNLNYDLTFIAYDVRGKQVLAHSMMGGKNVLSLANLSTGLYVYHIINNSGSALSYGKFNVLK